MNNSHHRSLKNILFRSTRARSHGGVLIGAIVAMVAMAALGAGMVSMLGTSYFHEVRSNHAERATYLAESGIRYAISTYKYDGGKVAMLDLDSEERIVPEGGQFSLTISEVETEELGYREEPFTIINDYPDPHDMIEVGENLKVEIDMSSDVSKLPEFYGVINVDGTMIRYRRFKINNIDNNNNLAHGTLYRVYAPVEIAAGESKQATLVMNDDRLAISSTGSYGTGFLGVTRTLEGDWFDYLSALGFSPPSYSEGDLTDEWDDPFPGGQKSDYNVTPIAHAHFSPTTHSQVYTSDSFVHPQGGLFSRTFLRIDGYNSIGTGLAQTRYHYVPFQHNSANLGMSQAWGFNNQMLSYDVQIKTATAPSFSHGAMGYMLRAVRHNPSNPWYTGYGISFMRYTWPVNSNSDRDFIPSSVKPLDSVGDRLNNNVLLVLWEQTGESSWDWIAYKNLHGLTPHTGTCTTHGITLQDGQTAVSPIFDQWVRGNQYCGDGYFIHDDSTVMIRIVERVIEGTRKNDIQLFFSDARWERNDQVGRTQDDDAFNVQNQRFGYEQRLSPVSGEELWKWPSIPDISDSNWVPAENDWFTAVAWDRVNPSRQPSAAELIADEGGVYSIVRDGKFTSEDFKNNQATHPEIVIHTFGHTSTSQTTLGRGRVYFSDLAVQLLKGSGSALEVDQPWAGPIIY